MNIFGHALYFSENMLLPPAIILSSVLKIPSTFFAKSGGDSFIFIFHINLFLHE